jgi:two-component system, OmpR family, response regulator
MNLHNKKFLVIEDDKHIFALIKAMFKPYQVKLTLEINGKEGLKRAINEDFHLILLDLMLPEKDGWEVCMALQKSGKEIPIIMLTAKAEETDKVLGLEMGADDYVTKPFSPRELIARIKAVLRRYENKPNKVKDKIYFSNIDLEINLKSYQIYVKEKPIALTPKEFELLVFLAQNENQVFNREQLLNQIWGFNNYAETRTIDEHIKRLRKKLSQAGLKENLLQTIWGIGYKFSAKEN